MPQLAFLRGAAFVFAARRGFCFAGFMVAFFPPSPALCRKVDQIDNLVAPRLLGDLDFLALELGLDQLCNAAS